MTLANVWAFVAHTDSLLVGIICTCKLEHCKVATKLTTEKVKT